MRPRANSALTRRARLPHKLAYSKTAKADAAVALAGAALATGLGYILLASLGSGGVELTDLVTWAGLTAWVFFGATWLGRAGVAELNPEPVDDTEVDAT